MQSNGVGMVNDDVQELLDHQRQLAAEALASLRFDYTAKIRLVLTSQLEPQSPSASRSQ